MSNPSTRIDVNRVSFYDRHGVPLANPYIVGHEGDDLDFASQLKISHSSYLEGRAVVVGQGAENAVDISCSSHVRLSGTFGSGLTPRRECDQVITIKGGSHDVECLRWVSTPETRRKAHVEVGNWMDQSQAINYDITLDLRHVDGGPVYVTVGWAIPFSVKLRGGCKYLFWRSMGLKVYWIAKYLVRAILRIPKGQKGPSWL